MLNNSSLFMPSVPYTFINVIPFPRHCSFQIQNSIFRISFMMKKEEEEEKIIS